MSVWRLAILGILLLLSCAVSSVSAVTYYVATTGNDSNPCTPNNIALPRRTIVAGIACLTNAGGDILFIRAGTYNQRVDTAIKSGTSDTNRTLIAAYPNETVILTATGSNCVLALSSPTSVKTFKYLIFDGLIIDGTGGTGYGICQPEDFAATVNIGWNIYRNGEVKNTHFSGMSGLNQFDEVHHMKIYSNGLTNAFPPSHGMYVCTTDARIHDNEIYHNGQYGIQFYYSGAQAPGCASRTKIYNNRLYDNGAITLTGGNTSGGMVFCCGDSMEVYNNLIYSNGRTGIKPGGGITPVGYSGPNTNIKIYNNTFWNNNGDGIQLLSGVPHADVRNNIFWQNSGQALNDLSNNTKPMDSSNLLVDPQFTNAAAGDFTPLAGSPAIDTGATMILPADALGQPRPSGSGMDIGAIEVQQGGGPGPGPGPGTIYVAQTGGSDTANDCNEAQQPSTPKQTITGVQGGISCLTSGSTLLIKQGTYAEKIDTSLLTIPGGADYANATTIAAFGNDVVTLAIPTSGVGLFFRNATNDHYIVIDRINIDGLNQNNTNGFVCYPGTHHIRFQNGDIKNTYYEPVFISGGANCEVLGSTLHDWTQNSGVHAKGAVSGTIVRGNTIYNGPGQGVRIDANEIGTAISGVVVEQNIISQVGVTSNLAALLLGGTGNTGLIVRNNLIYNSYRGIEIVTGTPGAKVYNNTVYNSTLQGIQVNAGATSTQVKNNISYGNGATPILDNGTSSACCTINQLLDPSFVNPAGGNFQLQSTSTAIDQGANLSPDVVFDLVGVNRADYRGYDYGAYEFTGTVSGAGDTPGPRRTGPAWRSREMFHLR